MAERGSRKIPVTERQFLWVQDDDKGEVILHVGPTMVSPTAADRVVVDDGHGGFVEDPSGQPQRMIELADTQYAVLHNPLENREDGPNGKFRPGRNESKVLRNGTRHMIPGPCSLYLRPGQRIEVRDAHELASNQYLVVKVLGEVDKSAPYHDITARSAAITTATAEDVGEKTGARRLDELSPVELRRGQLIVIRGLDTQFYIPPTGVDVVPDLSVDARGTQLTAQAAKSLLAAQPAPEPPPPPAPMSQELERELDDFAQEKPAPRKELKAQARLQGVEQSARFRQVQRPAPPPPPQEEAQAPEPAPALTAADAQLLVSSELHRQALEREARKGRLIRNAVVLGEKEFCVILDADGKRQIKRGPARVFPGPYDSFMTKGSNHRIYYAYELLPQRGLWLRFIAPLAKEKLTQKVPRGIELTQEQYQPGDELIVTGVNSFFFPFNEIEVLHPLTGQPHVGNDHSDVFIEAIGIDQKSGIYVRDLTTGEVRLVRGKTSYLVDPRKEVHITRAVPAEDWNLWVSALEPHKAATATVTTPWAISIIVPHNTAVLAASAEGQRVIEGPCVELLEFDEKLVPMSLSTKTPKSDAHPLKTCFLRTAGNRVSDVITIETADFVSIDVRVSYQVQFERSHRDRWFNHENYVGLLADHLRSLVRGRCRQIRLIELWPSIPNLLRDLILGERTEAGRKGRIFEENGMHVTEVEVLESTILDDAIAHALDGVQRESVSLQIGDRQHDEQLKSERLRHQVERERLTLRRDLAEATAIFDELMRKLEQNAALEKLRNREAAAREGAELEAFREAMTLKARLDRERTLVLAAGERRRTEAGVEAESQGLVHAEEQAHRRALSAIELELLEAQSRATVAERQAIQPGLVEALTALGDKIVLGEVAANMNLVSLLKGKDVATIFREVLGGASVSRTVEGMLPARKE